MAQEPLSSQGQNLGRELRVKSQTAEKHRQHPRNTSSKHRHKSKREVRTAVVESGVVQARFTRETK